jgi:antitoxin component of RelBE/YafQ-DinJ toxin-antitoxin module
MSNTVIGVRISQEDKALLEKVSKACGMDISDFIRKSFRFELARLGFLSAEEKKALGVA